ncbi:class II aldolase/adducin family protein [Myxococcus sp. 1LA]
MFDYSHKPPPESVIVHLAREPGSPYGVELEEALSQRAQRYGFTFTNVPHLLGETPLSSGATIRHIIYCTTGGFSWGTVERLAHLLQSYSTVSIAFTYASRSEMLLAEANVSQAKARFGDRLNFLMPDDCDSRGARASLDKLADNAVCDSVRIKYMPVSRSVSLPEVDARARDYFQRSARLYGEYRLFHRSPTDGYFAVRAADGFLITATKTHKIDFDGRRLAFVHDYDEARNTLEYSGAYLPSSDAVEASVVFRECPDIQYLYHTHASRLFTRNPAFQHWMRVGRLPYGEPELGRQLAAAVHDSADEGCVIMEEHGEVFFGTRDESPSLFFSRLSRSCEQAISIGALPASGTGG